MARSETISSLTAALAAAQGTMESAVFDKTNPHFRSKYASLASIWDAIREPLAKNGLSVTQTQEINGSGLLLNTTLWHTSGEWISSLYPLPHPNEVKPQEFGSFKTYARRYELSSMVGIVGDAEDDDANIAQSAQANGKLITAEQAAQLREALEVRNMPKERFLKWVAQAYRGKPIKDIEDVPERIFQTCIDKVREAGEPE